MSNKIGSYTIPLTPDVEEYTVEDQPIAGSERALDGTLHTTFAAVKRRWRAAWAGLTAAQRDLLLTELRKPTHMTWEPPEGGSFTVRVASSSWKVMDGAAAHYTVTAELEQE